MKPPLGESRGTCDSYFSPSWVPNLSSVLLGGDGRPRTLKGPRIHGGRGTLERQWQRALPLGADCRLPVAQGTNTFLKLAALTGMLVLAAPPWPRNCCLSPAPAGAPHGAVIQARPPRGRAGIGGRGGETGGDAVSVRKNKKWCVGRSDTFQVGSPRRAQRRRGESAQTGPRMGAVPACSLCGSDLWPVPHQVTSELPSATPGCCQLQLHVGGQCHWLLQRLRLFRMAPH